MKSDCCDAEAKAYWDSKRLSDRGELVFYVCEKCDKYCTVHPNKLTPDQVKAIRWPSTKDWYALSEEERWSMEIEDVLHWAIRYALQDLMPEGEG